MDNSVENVSVSVDRGGRTIFPDGIDPSGRSLYEYWNKIKGADLVPSRSALQPSALLPLLPNLLIFEYRDSEKLICRLAGTRLAEKLGLELTGTNLFDFYAVNHRAEARDVFDILRNQPCGLCVRQKLLSKHDSPFTAEFIFLPLRGAVGEISQLIAIAAVLEQNDTRPGNAGLPLSKPVSFDFFDIGAGLPPSPSADKRIAASG